MKMMAQLKHAFVIIWLILSVIACLTVAAPLLVQHDVLYHLTPECEWQTKYGKACPLCGMTRGFALVSSGRFREAAAFNEYALLVYTALLFDGIAFLVIAFRWFIVQGRRRLTGVLSIR